MKRKPIFSRQDSDLRRIKWTYSPFGYPRKGLGYGCQVFAHHIVIERMLGRKRRPDEITDHVNGNPLDVRRENLRITNWDGNGQNRRLGKFRGATFHKQSGKWLAQVKHHNVNFYLGLFTTKRGAALAAARKRNELHFLNATA